MRIRKCNKCGVDFKLSERSHKTYCHECRKVHDRSYRARAKANGTLWKVSKEYYKTPINKIKYEARAKVRKAIKTGLLKKLPCEVCNSLDTHAHHDDYLKPYQVKFLCRTHHEALHHRGEL